MIVLISLFFLGVLSNGTSKADALIGRHMKMLLQRDALDDRLLTISEEELVPLEAKFDDELDKVHEKYSPQIEKIYEIMDSIEYEALQLTEELIGLQQAIQSSCLLWNPEERLFFDDENCPLLEQNNLDYDIAN